MTKRDEDRIQKQIVAELRARLPKAIIHHSPNEGNRGGTKGIIDGRRRKAMGLFPGYPDLEVICNGKVTFIEVKTPKGKLAPSQKLFMEAVQAQGFDYLLMRSADEVPPALDILRGRAA